MMFLSTKIPFRNICKKCIPKNSKLPPYTKIHIHKSNVFEIKKNENVPPSWFFDEWLNQKLGWKSVETFAL